MSLFPRLASLQCPRLYFPRAQSRNWRQVSACLSKSGRQTTLHFARYRQPAGTHRHQPGKKASAAEASHTGNFSSISQLQRPPQQRQSLNKAMPRRKLSIAYPSSRAHRTKALDELNQQAPVSWPPLPPCASSTPAVAGAMTATSTSAARGCWATTISLPLFSTPELAVLVHLAWSA